LNQISHHLNHLQHLPKKPFQAFHIPKDSQYGGSSYFFQTMQIYQWNF
jgi:hypothetical protein